MVFQYPMPQYQLPQYSQQMQYTQQLLQIYYQSSQPMTQAALHNALSQPAPTGYPNQVSYLSLTKNQDFYSSIPLEGKNVGETSTPSRQNQINNTIPLTTITENTTLAIIFPFNIDHLNTTSFFSGAAINQDKPIMALYTNARVGNIDIKLILDSGSAGSIIMKQLINQLGHQIDYATTAQIITVNGNTKTSIGEIDNFSFEINGIQISTKVLVMKAIQY
ncbi:hypothetical protein G9A89_021830 [Geosiphon pyriformis]|nr:hypothetical protein G9A89_021830 [Geosiphon pyriformis]